MTSVLPNAAPDGGAPGGGIVRPTSLTEAMGEISGGNETGTSLWVGAFRRLRRNPSAIVGAVIVALFVLVAVLAPVLAPYEPGRTQWASQITPTTLPPFSAEHPLGLDSFGSDFLTQLIHGARQSLIIGIVSTLLGLAGGAALGLLAGAFGGWVDTLVMRIVDILLSIPALLLAVSVAAIVGRRPEALMIAIAAAQVPIFARLLRGSMLRQRGQDYVLAATSLGLRRRTIVMGHILPNSLGPVIVQATLVLATAIIEVAALSYLGMGSPDPTVAEWGRMLVRGQERLQSYPHLTILPGLCIAVTALGFTLLGEALREALDPEDEAVSAVAAASAAPAAAAGEPLLSVRDLEVVFGRRGQPGFTAVDQVSFDVAAGEVVGIVGESGSGKSVTSMAILGLLGRRGVRVSGRALYRGRDLLTMPEAERSRYRGAELAMVFQDPMSSLNPVVTVGTQVSEVLRAHQRISAADAKSEAIDLLQRCGIPDPARRFGEYPHQLSGGMRQRALIATALACKPRLLICDEPTTALDVTIQAQVLELLVELVSELGTAMIMITHDLGVVAGLCDRVNVMYAGRIVEQASCRELFAAPRHRYTEGLLASIPRLDGDRSAPLTPIPGTPRDVIAWSKACAFAPRCRHVTDACVTGDLALTELAEEHDVRCVNPAPAPGASAPSAPASGQPEEAS